MIRDHIQAASMKKEAPRPEDDNVSLDEYVKRLGANDKTRRMVNLWVRVMHGIESTEESAAWFIDYCRTNHGLLAIRADDHTGGQYLRLTGGAQQIPDGLANLVGRNNIRLSSPVLSINDFKSHVAVTTTTGQTYIGKKCIVSVPSTMYQDMTISPPLPAPVQDVANNTKLGHYNKAIVCYDTPWWRDLGYNGFVMSFKGPVIVARDTSIDEKRLYALTCFVNGNEGEKWSRMHPHERRSVVLDQLATLYNVSADSEVYRPIEFFDQIWKHEQYSKGALAPVTAIGHYTKYASVYGKPVGNLHFVGTEFSRDWKGYMEGALVSGELGAAEVSKSLQNQQPSAKL
jgi:monoamine oxidase